MSLQHRLQLRRILGALLPERSPSAEVTGTRRRGPARRRRVRLERLQARELLAADVLLLEDFEDNDVNYVVTGEAGASEFHDGTSDYFTIVPLNGAANPVDAFSGFDGANFFAAEDIDDGNTRPSTQTLEFNIEIANVTNLTFSGLFGAGGNGAVNPAYDSNDGLLVRATIDDQTPQNLLAFEAVGTTNQLLKQDADFDGTGDADGFMPTNALTTFDSISINGTGSNLKLEIMVSSNDGNGEFAFDNIQVTGEPDEPSEPVFREIRFASPTTSGSEANVDDNVPALLVEGNFLDLTDEQRTVTFTVGSGSTAGEFDYQLAEQLILPAGIYGDGEGPTVIDLATTKPDGSTTTVENGDAVFQVLDDTLIEGIETVDITFAHALPLPEIDLEGPPTGVDGGYSVTHRILDDEEIRVAVLPDQIFTEGVPADIVIGLEVRSGTPDFVPWDVESPVRFEDDGSLELIFEDTLLPLIDSAESGVDYAPIQTTTLEVSNAAVDGQDADGLLRVPFSPTLDEETEGTERIIVNVDVMSININVLVDGPTENPLITQLFPGGIEDIFIADAAAPPLIDDLDDRVATGDIVRLAVTGTDADGGDEPALFFDEDSVLTVDIELPAGEVTADQVAVFALELFRDGSLYENYYGAGEKWLRSAATGDWYIVLPAGDVIRWDGGGSITGDLVAKLSSEFHVDPLGVLTNANEPGDLPSADGALEATAVVDGRDVVVMRQSGFGTALVTVTATDGGGLVDTESFEVEFNDGGATVPNQSPVIDPIENILGFGTDEVFVGVSGTETDDVFGDDSGTPAERFDADATITATAEVEGDAAAAQQAVHDLDLGVSGSLYEDFYGAGEKWLRSSLTSQWYFILPSGDLFRWDGSDAAVGEQVASLDPSAHEDPVATIVDAVVAQDIPVLGQSDLQVEIEVADQVIRVRRLAGFGDIRIQVRATGSDGLIDESEFLVTFADIN